MLGAPDTCFLISADRVLDGREMQLADALEPASTGHFGTFVSCIPGKLGYFNGEGVESAWLLKR